MLQPLILIALLIIAITTVPQQSYSQSRLDWSNNPGAFEQQLKRRFNNPLFPKNLRPVSHSELSEAKKRDNSDFEKANLKFLNLTEKILKLPDEVTSSEINVIREEIDNLIEECIGIGGRANIVLENLIKLRHETISSWRKALQSHPEALETLNAAEEMNPINKPEFSHPFIMQMMRKDGPISSAEVLPSLLSEDSQTIRLVLGLMEKKELIPIQSTALSIIKSALDEGATIENLEGKLRALGIENLQR